MANIYSLDHALFPRPQTPRLKYNDPGQINHHSRVSAVSDHLTWLDPREKRNGFFGASPQEQGSRSSQSIHQRVSPPRSESVEKSAGRFFTSGGRYSSKHHDRMRTDPRSVHRSQGIVHGSLVLHDAPKHSKETTAAWQRTPPSPGAGRLGTKRCRSRRLPCGRVVIINLGPQNTKRVGLSPHEAVIAVTFGFKKKRREKKKRRGPRTSQGAVSSSF